MAVVTSPEAMAEDDDLPRLLNDRYRLEAPLGQGGMGVVYRGTDTLIQRAIAVKLIRPASGLTLDDDVAERFLREAKNTARLHHEHLIEVFDLGRTEDGDLYLVMELLEGESLSARLRREGAFDASTCVHIGAQIARALQVAHTSEVIHRDLKPANVMLVTRAGDDAFVKVLDFGVAKSLAGDQQTQLTQTGMLVGTLDYMAPEQIMGHPVEPRSDIYSLGIVLYRMACGLTPFRDGGVPALVNAHLNTPPQPLAELVAEIPPALEAVILKCLAKRPAQRFRSMTELAEALEASLLPGAVAVSLEAPSDDEEEDVGDPTVVGAFGSSPGDPSVPDPVPSDDTTLARSLPEPFDETTHRLAAGAGRRLPAGASIGSRASPGLPRPSVPPPPVAPRSSVLPPPVLPRVGGAAAPPPSAPHPSGSVGPPRASVLPPAVGPRRPLPPIRPPSLRPPALPAPPALSDETLPLASFARDGSPSGATATADDPREQDPTLQRPTNGNLGAAAGSWGAPSRTATDTGRAVARSFWDRLLSWVSSKPR